MKRVNSEIECFSVETERQAAYCRRIGCRVVGNYLRQCFPPLGVTINLPFKVLLGKGFDAQKFRLVRKSEGYGTVRRDASWEVEA